MRDVALRLLEMLGDRAAQPDDRDILDAILALPRWCAARRGGRRDIGVEILLRDAADGAGPADELQLDAEIPGAPPHRRRRQRLAIATTGGHRRETNTLTPPPAF